MENNSRDTINVAQLGVGYWGPNLLRNLISNPRFNVRVVVDLSEARRDFVKKFILKFMWIAHQKLYSRTQILTQW